MIRRDRRDKQSTSLRYGSSRLVARVRCSGPMSRQRLKSVQSPTQGPLLLLCGNNGPCFAYLPRFSSRALVLDIEVAAYTRIGRGSHFRLIFTPNIPVMSFKCRYEAISVRVGIDDCVQRGPAAESTYNIVVVLSVMVPCSADRLFLTISSVGHFCTAAC